jgi:hypothetical protein
MSDRHMIFHAMMYSSDSALSKCHQHRLKRFIFSIIQEVREVLEKEQTDARHNPRNHGTVLGEYLAKLGLI